MKRKRQKEKKDEENESIRHAFVFFFLAFYCFPAILAKKNIAQLLNKNRGCMCVKLLIEFGTGF
jgi:hypothetical protein